MHAVNKNHVFVAKAMYFSNPFGIAFAFTSNLHTSCIIKWLSKAFKLWNITGTLLVSLRLILQLQCAEPLYFPIYLLLYYLLHQTIYILYKISWIDLSRSYLELITVLVVKLK